MEDLTVSEYLEKYPYLKDIAKYTLFTSKEEIDLLKKSDNIKINSEDVSIEFLKKILNDDNYFDYVFKFFNNDIDNFAVAYIIAGDIGGALHYKKSTIMKALDTFISSEGIELSEEEVKRCNILRDSISFERFIENYRGKDYEIDIDGIHYSIPIEKIISFMEISDIEFDDICSNNEIKDLNNIPKDHFIYGAIKFLKDNNIFDKYLLPDKILDRYLDICSLKKMDLEALNKHLTTEDTLYKNIIIDKDLENAILDGMPENVSDLEKSIYIYIKMCKLLTYDEEYFAVNQTGVATEKHSNKSYVSSISLDNNRVVCYEFNLIYSKLLNDLGIHFRSDYKNMVGEAYGAGHANLEYRSGKFLVSADSVTSILQGDIARAKLNQPLEGLVCLNRNSQTQEEFNKSLTKIYKLIEEQEKNNYNKKQTGTLDELLKEYSQTTDSLKDVSLNERLFILINKVNSTKMVGIDSLSYVLQLRKILFTKEQRDNNIQLTIIRNNEPFDNDRIAMASAIFTINDKSFKDNEDRNIYYYFNPNHELVMMSKEELQSKFDNGTFAYVDKDDPRIPGIREGKGVKR